MKKSLARLDLNLLYTLQLLLEEQNVSRAAKKLNVTPSTVSKSLGKLRHWFDDPLFIKTPKGLKPTPLAQSMTDELAAWLQMANQISHKRADETSKGITFNLAMESPLHLSASFELTQQIYQKYPGAKVKFSNWDYDSLELITRGEADIGFTGRESHPRSRESLELLPYFIDFEVLFSDQPLVFLRKDHPALSQKWHFDAFLSYPHINIMWEKTETWALDDVLNELGATREIPMTMPSFEQSLFMAAQPGHNMITTAPHYCRDYCQRLHPELTCLPIPLAEEHQQKLTIPFTMIWHKRNNNNPKIQWLKQVIKSLYGSAE